MRRAAVLGVLLLAGACVAQPMQRAPVTTAPPPSVADPDAAVLADDCLACHTGDMIRQQRLTEKQWAKTVDKMRGWGAPTEDDAVAPLVSRLAAAHSLNEGPFIPQTLSADQANSLFARQPDGAFSGGDTARGHALYTDRCAPCHADDAKGGAMGVALAGRHVLDRAPELAAVVRSGRGRMPGYEDSTDAQVADLLAYLRSLPAH